MDEQLTVYANGTFCKYGEAKIGLLTHALHYGTGCFEGVRGFWSARDEELYLFQLEDHFERLHASAKILMMKVPHTVPELWLMARDEPDLESDDHAHQKAHQEDDRYRICPCLRGNVEHVAPVQCAGPCPHLPQSPHAAAEEPTQFPEVGDIAGRCPPNLLESSPVRSCY